MFDKYLILVQDQFVYGGKKYALSGGGQRESTDVLFDKYGKNWLIGTIDKYTFRFKNLKRERDLLKIACYMYIMWLKRGYHIDNQRVNPIDTNVKVKADFFPVFSKRVESQRGLELELEHDNELEVLERISDMLGRMSREEWTDMSEKVLIAIFIMTYYIWNKEFSSVKEHDTDTYNEKRT